MSTGNSPFDPGPEGRATHLVLENTAGRLSLWPVWREVPAGWSVRFGPAPHAACAATLEPATRRTP
ncbi:MbtH family NRPS accessory protein [Streptomyces sp. NPDC057067]|uniref:MbtH family NRPS accessory protein n=1 Tax=Streptomyces TaxID=1883 RepID=UPI00100E75E4|nr:MULTISPECIES: MbtH family NRPS accessory protein [Streptomyces]MBL1286359.1 MbtH family protein [Streptomyces silvae]